MKTTLAALLLTTTISAANATTYNIDGTFTTLKKYCEPTNVLCFASYPNTTVNSVNVPLTGTVEIDDGLLTALSINPIDMFMSTPMFVFTPTFITQFSYQSQDNWSLTARHDDEFLNLTDLNGILVNPTFNWTPFDPRFQIWSYTGPDGTITTPIPSALVLFISGLTLLGFLKWKKT
jgi:hypothetical protein